MRNRKRGRLSGSMQCPNQEIEYLPDLAESSVTLAEAQTRARLGYETDCPDIEILRQVIGVTDFDTFLDLVWGCVEPERGQSTILAELDACHPHLEYHTKQTAARKLGLSEAEFDQLGILPDDGCCRSRGRPRVTELYSREKIREIKMSLFKEDKSVFLDAVGSIEI